MSDPRRLFVVRRGVTMNEDYARLLERLLEEPDRREVLEAIGVVEVPFCMAHKAYYVDVIGVCLVHNALELSAAAVGATILTCVESVALVPAGDDR